MTIIVDASVVVAALVDTGSDGGWAEEVLAHRDGLVAPEFLVIEASNVLRRLERLGSISEDEADDAHSALVELPVRYTPLYPLLDRVWALRHNTTAYDACYVAVAELMEAPLATLDARLAAQPVDCTFLTPELFG